MTRDTYTIVIYIGYFFLAGIFSFLVNGLFLQFASNLGMRNNSDHLIRWSSTTKPALGGVSFFILFLLSIASYSIFFEENKLLYNPKFLGFLAASVVGFLIGLADDAYNTKPILKLGGQLACAVILVVSGNKIVFFGNEILDIGLTFFWIIGLMNSINMLDNMDGITSTVSISIILSSLFILLWKKDLYNPDFILLEGVLCALIGFLFYNWNPSKMYMGDTGSQFLGVFLAAIGINYFWMGHEAQGYRIQTKQFIEPLLIFMIPIIDTTIVTINRLLRGQSPMVGGRDHTTHHLSYMGLTDRQVALTFFGLSFISFLGLMMIEFFITDWGYTQLIVFFLYFLGLLGTMFYITKRFKQPTK